MPAGPCSRWWRVEFEQLFLYIASQSTPAPTMRQILMFLFILMSVRLCAQDFSNKGKDFWLGYGNHVQMNGSNAQRMSLYITSDVATTGLVEIPGLGFTQNFSISPNQII